MKKRGLAIGLAVVVVSIASVRGQAPSTGVSVQFKMPLETKALKGAPYSAETVSDRMQTLPDGNRIVQHSTGRVYRDSEGRVRREEDRPSGSPGVSITDPVAGAAWSLDPETHVAWKTPVFAGEAIMNTLDAAKVEAAVAQARKLAEARARGQGKEAVMLETSGGRVEVRRPSTEQRAEETLPAKVLEGVRVDGRRVTTTIPADAVGNERPIVMITEEWTSPDLQVLVSTERTDPREGSSSYRLLNIILGEPPASLFQVPPDYTIRETGLRRFERQ